MLRSTLVVLLLVLLLISDCVDGKKGRRRRGRIRMRCKTLKPGRNIDVDPAQNATFVCHEGGKLFEINVESTVSRHSCSGWQAQTLVKSMACVGSVVCPDILLTNATPIIKSSQTVCLGRHPDRVSASALCTQKDVAIEHMEKPTWKSADRGILASPHYPWNYPSDRLEVIATMRPKNPTGSFYYTLHKLDLAEDDSLTVKGREERRYTITNNSSQAQHDHVTAKDGEVTVTFKAANDFLSGHGFILCYKWSDSAVSDVCKELTVPPQKVKTCRPRGKKRGPIPGRRPKKQRRNGKKGKKRSTPVTPE